MIAESKQRYCAFCGLPLSASAVLGGDSSQIEDNYCCTGCMMVADVDKAESASGSSANNLLRLGLAVFFTMNVMVFTMALWSYDVYPEETFDTALATSLRSVFRWASMVFSLPVLWLLGGPIIRGVWQTLKRGALTTDVLILLGVGAAYLYSTVSVLRGAGHVYFEVGVMVLVFVSLGRWLEAKGKRRTGESLDRLADLLPKIVRKKNPAGDFVDSPRAEVNKGDVLRVLPGERFPVDGLILQGTAHVDEQMVTGESKHTQKATGQQIYSGTMNIDGDMLIEVTAEDGQETVSRLIQMVRTARMAKGRQEQIVDRIAFWFIPLVCLIAISAGIYWWQNDGVEQGILISLAVVLIACPCALGLATPMAVWTALGRAAEAGVLFRSGLVLEKLATIKHACFDKTGTLTSGKPELKHLLVSDDVSRSQLLEVVSALAEGSNHPLSLAILEYLREHSLVSKSENHLSIETVPGKGLTCLLPEIGEVYLGSKIWLTELGFSMSLKLEDGVEKQQELQNVFIGWNNKIHGVFCFDEELREEVPEAIAACRSLNLDLRVLTGDTELRALQFGREISLSATGSQLPEDKISKIESLRKTGGVAMVGEGLNDAPALAAADVGVALGCGADVSRDAAGVCLLADDIRSFPWTVALARKTVLVVKQNLFWAFAYNCIGMGLAVSGRLNPILAAAAMALSSLMVVSNSLRLGQFSDKLPIENPSSHEYLSEEQSSTHSKPKTLSPQADMAVPVS